MEINRDDVKRIIERIRKKLCFDDEISSIISINVEVDYNDLIYGISNEFLADFIEMITGYEVQVIGDVEELYECPCCGYKTLSEKYDVNEGTGYDICPICGWEDDGTTEIDEYRSINRGSIADYRKKIANKKINNKWLKM